MSALLRCVACGRLRDPGAVLAVIPLDWRSARYVVCRPELDIRCLQIVPSALEARLELYDRRAAAALDRARVQQFAQEVQHA